MQLWWAVQGGVGEGGGIIVFGCLVLIWMKVSIAFVRLLLCERIL